MKSKVHIKKVESYSIDKIELFVREALSIIDKTKSLFSTGQKVLLKPNLLRGFSPENCVTTHPKVVEAMCRVLKDYSIGQITISDSPALGSLQAVASKAGYDYLKSKYDVKFLLREGNIVPVYKIEKSNTKISSNIFSFAKNLFASVIKDRSKYLIISVTPYTFFSFLLLIVFRKKIFLYLRSDGKKEIEAIYGKILSIIYKTVEKLIRR